MKSHVRATGIIFEDSEGNILVLKRHSNSPESETWGLVGGKIDEGENALTAVVRECKEETGLEIKSDDLEFVKKYSWDREDITIDFDVFKHKKDLEFEIVLEEDKSTEYEWANPEDLYKQKDLMIGLYPILEDVYNLS